MASPSPAVIPCQPLRCEVMLGEGSDGEEGMWIRSISKEYSGGFNKHFSADQNLQAY